MPSRHVTVEYSVEPLRSALIRRASELGFDSSVGEETTSIVVAAGAEDSTICVLLQLPGAGGVRTVANVQVPAVEDTVVGAILAVDQMTIKAEVSEEIRRVLSHDIRGPFAIILGYCEILNTQVQGSLTEYQQGAVAKIERQSERLLTMLEGVEQTLAGDHREK